MSLNSLVVAVSTLDTEPRLECGIVQTSSWALSTVIGHEAVDEGVRGGLHENT
jgi:hypothetical protein